MSISDEPINFSSPSDTRPCELSVVIPVYNEQSRLPATLDRLVQYLQAQPHTWEIIISDDGSTDQTCNTIAQYHPYCRILKAECNQGKGAAVRRGMLNARGQWRLFTDADLSTPIDELDGMLAQMKQTRCDVIIASRALPESVLMVRQPWWRELSGRMFNRIVQPVSGLPFVDTQCGFKLFSRRAAELLFTHQSSDGWAFDVELLILAQYYGLDVQERAVHWINDEASKVNLLSAAPRMLRDLIVFRWRRWNGLMNEALYDGEGKKL